MEEITNKAIQVASSSASSMTGAKKTGDDDNDSPVVPKYSINVQLSEEPESLETPTVVTMGDCRCELLSVDCLDSIRCLPQQDDAKRTVAQGVATRKVIKAITSFEGTDGADSHYPLGKGIQYATIRAWKRMKKNGSLPRSYSNSKMFYINETHYDYCTENKLLGKNCFFKELPADEDLDTMEEEAVSAFGNKQDTDAIEQDVKEYVRKAEDDGNSLPGLGHLLMFSHINRMRFNRQPPVRDFYSRHVDTTPSKNSRDETTVLRVSVHMRRADSCGHKMSGYETEPSTLDSTAQPSSLRMCYDTGVYMKQIQRIQRESARPLEVYLSTDHHESVFGDIEKDFPDLYQNVTWKFLNYNRDIYNYGGMIDNLAVNKKGDALGEAGVADLWLLSFGEVFVGHLGSRFGKVGWSLATARYNHFIPFFTVDGHSFCCAIDENCALMKDYMDSMEVCISYQQELMGVRANKDYWTVGSTVRVDKVKQDRERAKAEKAKEKAEND